MESDCDTVMADEIDVMELLHSLQQENAKNKMSQRDISRSIFHWYLKIMGFIQVDDNKFERRAFGMDMPFEFRLKMVPDHDNYIALSRNAHSNNNLNHSSVEGYGFRKFPSLNLEQSSVEKDAKRLRNELRKLHSLLRKVWENTRDDDDDTTSSSSEVESDME
ncbi:uncharacterized protein LOC135835245 [Planococcus citri]|uniref:uncharacterized protein LOC135835245 n=1 Tax=Planococcus citri TaxID=170843 RepID=UPI0031F9724B